MLFKRIALLFATLITILCSLPAAANLIAVSAQENTDSDVLILTSIEQDLGTFNFDPTRYFLDKENYLHPVVITFKESNTKDYYDLLYVYARLDPTPGLKGQMYYPNIEFTSIDVDYYYNDYLDKLYDNDDKVGSNFEIIHSDRIEVNEYGFVYRLVIDAYGDYRECNYREYQFTSLNYTYWSDGFVPGKKVPLSVEIDNSYLFDNSNSLIFNNCVNILAEDAHCWSYHFDEDNFWENVWESFWGQRQDVLTDQLFYSFYIKNWDVKELKSIDIRYKKTLLEGYRYNEHDTGKDTEFYKGTTGTIYDPKYYLWNDNNTKERVYKDVYLGNTIQQASNSISYTKKTINGDVKNSASTQFKEYEWKSILNSNEFISTFGADSDIYKHASYFLTDPMKEYWIINFDQFFYKYNKVPINYSTYTVGYIAGVPTYRDRHIIGPEDFFNYLFEHGFSLDDLYKYVDPNITSGTVGYDALDAYYFYQEYVFDMTATQMTFVDNKNVKHTLPVSVAPVNEEGSGGGSLKPTDGLDIKGLLQLIALIFGILILICFMPILVTLFTFIVNVLSIPFKWIGNLFKRKKE